VSALPRAPRPDALALDLACGQGRHSRELARLGYEVIAMDVSLYALEHVRRDSDGQSRSRVHPVQADVDAWPFAPQAFDLVVQVDFLDRSIFALLVTSLRPGGLLVVDTFLDAGHPNADGPSRPEFVLARNELPRSLPGLDVVRYEEHDGETARAIFVGRRR